MAREFAFLSTIGPKADAQRFRRAAEPVLSAKRKRRGMPCQVQVENRRMSRGMLRRASFSLLAFMLSLCFAVAKRCSGAVASPHFVQAVAAAGMGKGLSVSFTRNTVAGDIILVGVDFTMNATLLLVTDSQGNPFNRVGNLLTSPGGARSGVYYAKNAKGAQKE